MKDVCQPDSTKKIARAITPTRTTREKTRQIDRSETYKKTCQILRQILHQSSCDISKKEFNSKMGKRLNSKMGKMGKIGQKINKLIPKKKYQMPKIEIKLDKIEQIFKTKNEEHILFSTLDLGYAF